MAKDDAALPESGGTAEHEREPYEPPAITWEEALEVRPNLMAACGQKTGGGGDCEFTPYS